jgi:GT2 family glycosyltransferase
MANALSTVVIVPRERFSFTQRSLESILTATKRPYELLYVDGCSPAPIRNYLERQAAEHQFRLIRTDHFLAPNIARNLALMEVRTKYVVFLDNDALVSPDWLQPLEDCAESTGAWVVGPVYCEHEPIAQRIHMAGGTAEIIVEQGRRALRESHRYYGKSLAQIGPSLRREPVEQIEFHCALVRMDTFQRLGPLDEALLSAAEHTDLCLLVRAAGGEVYLEPKSVVTYVPASRFDPTDLPYYQLRWSHAWNEATLDRFGSKWDLPADDPGLCALRKWLSGHRRLAFEPSRQASRIFGRRGAKWLDKLVFAPWEEASNRVRFPAVRETSHSGARKAA